jgi:hypothetical protein
MKSYLDILKWTMTGKNETYDKTNEIYLNNIVVIYDSESEFENVHSIDKPLKINIDMEENKKEQIVRDILDSNTIEHIKSNCNEYVNDEIKIINDFSTIIESFNHIKEKIIEFESCMKEFESDIKIKTTNHDLSNAELDNRINIIDNKLNNTIGMIEQMNSTSNELMKKIIKLENIINTHYAQRKELLTKLNKVVFAKSKCLLTKYMYNLYHIFNLNFSDDGMEKMLFASTCVIGIFVILKYQKVI